jgi:hypothetical protein
LAFGLPKTCDLNPFSRYSCAKEMPETPVFRLSVTSRMVSPMDDTMPIPVITTRRKSVLMVGFISMGLLAPFLGLDSTRSP